MTDLLLIKPIEAELHRDIEKFQFLNKSVCIIKFGEKTLKTQGNKGTILKPFWTETFNFEKSHEKFVKIEVWNSITKDQDLLVGETEIPVELIEENNYYSAWFDLKREGYHVGQILIGTEFLLNTKKKEESEEKVADLEFKGAAEENPLKEIDYRFEGIQEANQIEKTQAKTSKGATKLKELFASKRTEERAIKKRVSLDEADLLGKDPHNPQFLKKNVVQFEADLDDSEKLDPNLNLAFIKN